MWGNIATDNGINKNENHLAGVIFARPVWVSGMVSEADVKLLHKEFPDPSASAIVTKVTNPNTMNTLVWRAFAQAVPRIPPKKTYVNTTPHIVAEANGAGTPYSADLNQPRFSNAPWVTVLTTAPQLTTPNNK